MRNSPDEKISIPFELITFESLEFQMEGQQPENIKRPEYFLDMSSFLKYRFVLTKTKHSAKTRN